MSTETRRAFRTPSIIIFLISFIIVSNTSQANALSPLISKDSINFLEKTGQAMAEVAEAVKPAVVNISIEKTEKVTDSSMEPFLNDPFFRKFFGI